MGPAPLLALAAGAAPERPPQALGDPAGMPERLVA
jgi:hypothetical protein